MAWEHNGVQELADIQPAQQQHSLRKERPTLLGLPVDLDRLDIPISLDEARANGEPFLVTFLNPNACYISEIHPGFSELLSLFHQISCDGIGMVVAARLKLSKRIPRQAFDTTSIALPALEWARKNQVPVLLVGGQDQVSSRAAEILVDRMPGLQILGTFSGFDDGPVRAHDVALATDGCMVICGMGAPNQEQFLVDLSDAGWTGIGFTCGGFMDQLCERFYYYPKWVNKFNLRFAYRLIKEPRRLGKRYLRDYRVFVKRLLFHG